jgi:tetratricopeptide (TPR) repeat protein
MRKIVISAMLLLLPSLAGLGQAELRAFLRIISEFTANKQYLEAVRVCDRTLAKYPESADLFYLRGINHYLLEEYEKAEEDFTKTLALQPNYPDVYLYRAKTRKALKKYMAALRDYRKAKNENMAKTVSSLTGDAIRSLFTD